MLATSKKAPGATEKDCPKEMGNYKKWCHENADGSFKPGKHSGNCKNIKKVLNDLGCFKRRLGAKFDACTKKALMHVLTIANQNGETKECWLHLKKLQVRLK